MLLWWRYLNTLFKWSNVIYFYLKERKRGLVLSVWWKMKYWWWATQFTCAKNISQYIKSPLIDKSWKEWFYAVITTHLLEGIESFMATFDSQTYFICMHLQKLKTRNDLVCLLRIMKVIDNSETMLKRTTILFSLCPSTRDELGIILF